MSALGAMPGYQHPRLPANGPAASERAREQPEAAAPLEAAADSITMLRLQQTAGNTAVSRLLSERSLGRRSLARDGPTATATAPATFTSAAIQKVYDDNKAASSLTQTTAQSGTRRARGDRSEQRLAACARASRA